MRLLLFFCAAQWAAFAAETGAIELLDVHGARHRPLELKEKKATVLIFTTHDCPVANTYAPEIGRICMDYEAKGVAIFLVHVDPDLKPEAARKHAADFSFRCPVLLDPARKLVKRAGATMTPEAVVFSPEGSVVYRGRIDNLYEDFGKRRVQATQRDLREALDALLAGRKVPNSNAVVVGCAIPALEGEK